MPNATSPAQQRATLVRRWRERQDWLQADAAEHLGISERTYRKLENPFYSGGFMPHVRSAVIDRVGLGPRQAKLLPRWQPGRRPAA